MTTRILFAITLSATLCGCASREAAQRSHGTDPILVRIDEIDREDWGFRPRSEADGTAVLDFLFKSRSRQEVYLLWMEGVRLRRPVHIVDGKAVVARATVAGGAEGLTLAGKRRYGMMLRFPSLADARRASVVLSEDPWEALDRRLADRRSWILPPSGGASGNTVNPPATGIPNPPPKMCGP